MASAQRSAPWWLVPRSRVGTVTRLLGAVVSTLMLGAAVGASSAGASILRATSVLPPGESGFVSVTCFATGKGCSHLYDQQQLFIHFQRKDAMLGQPGTAEDPRPGVQIVRDSYGVPAVTGATSYDLWWGAGWATAQDRLAQLEIFRFSTRGELASVLGPSYLPTDIEIRRDFYTQSELATMFARLPAAMQQRYEAYDAGINAWVDNVNSNPSALPAEFLALGTSPTHFSVEDLLAIGAYLARTTPSSDGSELENMEAIQRSGPSRFNRILPLRIKGQISTIPRADGLFPSDPGRTRADERTALKRSYAYVRHLPVPKPGNLGVQYVSGTKPKFSSSALTRAVDDGAGSMNPLAAIHRGGSYMVAIGSRRTHRAFLFNGPELGFSAPEELYEIELHGPGVDVRGVTVAGVPVIAIGHNAHIAFGLTSGLSETNSLYAEHLVPRHPDEYYYKGRVRQMSCRDETFTYSLGTALLRHPRPSAASPPHGSTTLRLCRTIHGPVQERVGNIAYARRYTTWMREVSTITGLAAVNGASTIRQVNRDTRLLTWNENLMAADDHGNIGYWHPGLLPRLPKRWDERLPLLGNGSAEWRGFLSVAQRPHVIDPKQGWLANWNTLPSMGWTTGNDPAPERVAGPWFRGAWLDRLASRPAKHPSFGGMDHLIYEAGTIAQQRPLATRELRRALHGAHGRAATVLRTLLDWNGSYTRESHGKVEPGVATWQEFKLQMQRLALHPLGTAGRLIGGGGPNDEHEFDASLGQAYALRALGPSGWRRAAAATFTVLAGRFRTRDPRRWREARAMFPESALGAENPPPLPFFDRGTFEQVVALGS